MPKRFIDLVKSIIPLSRDETARIERLREILDEQDFKNTQSLIRQRRAKIVSEKIQFRKFSVDTLKLKSIQDEDKKAVDDINSKLIKHGKAQLWNQISPRFFDTIKSVLAPSIYGFDIVRRAILMQFFSPESIHILLMGDPGTGKTVFLQSVSSVFPITSFGLGSGTSGAGLSVTVKGNQVSKGLLAMADKGLCCIDELNLMKKEDRASLYSAMEKGFITYDKGGKHYRFDARISLLATANPRGDRFTGETMEEIRKEVPFDPALLTRFHLVFFIKRPSVDRFMQISRRIIKEEKKPKLGDDEIKLFQDYILNAREIEVSLPKDIETKLMETVKKLKEQEINSLVDITPRTVIGMIRMAKASARMELREIVEEKDLKLAEEILVASISGAVE